MSKALLSPDRLGSVDEIRGEVFKVPWQNFFTVEDTIGRGKFAIVKKCVEKSTGKRFAAKCIRKRRHCRDCTQDILHEIAVLELSSSHPHLIDLYQIYESSTEFVLILEYAAGGEIFDYCVGLKDAFSETKVRQLFRQILEAVDFLHDRNIVHLDLKPQNILLTDEKDGDIKLVDFGLSKHLSENLEIREILGTPDYVAPEVLNFEPISTSTDIWSLGVVCYVMLTGVSPFLGETKIETLMNVTTGVVDFPNDLFDEKQTACKDLILKMLQLDPQNRVTAKDCLQHTWLSGFLSPHDGVERFAIQDNVFHDNAKNLLSSKKCSRSASLDDENVAGNSKENNLVDENDNLSGGRLSSCLSTPLTSSSLEVGDQTCAQNTAENDDQKDDKKLFSTSASQETKLSSGDSKVVNPSDVKPTPKRPRFDNLESKSTEIYNLPTFSRCSYSKTACKN
uniref:non-specific serine/threonine protein kinase n=1 Tax=Phallusia mammillata TaxID=59560 RepID=A0A6F9DU32_9ASCI|nr:serine/threonine-protein kinase 17A-like [Phallusia mammillata]